jgi:uncharacterized protein
MSRSLLPDIVILCAGIALDAAVLREVRHLRWLRGWRGIFVLMLRALWLAASLELGVVEFLRLQHWLPLLPWVRAAGLCWVLVAGIALLALHAFGRSAAAVDPVRRRLLQAATFAGVAVPIAASSFGIVRARSDAEVREVEIFVTGLHPDLDNLRIVQISDIHLSPFVSRAQLARAVDQANELRADLAVVTGDLITSIGDPLDDCIDELRRLRSPNGVWGCLGNHEIVAGAEDYAAARAARFGIRFLRQDSAVLAFGAARLNLAGVDYQRNGTVYLPGAAALRRADATNILLCHNPDPFPVAAAQRWDVTIAGHTHGGQITLEYLHSGLNPARFYTPFVYGPYRRGTSTMFVTRGIGTVALPLRLGTLPEIPVLRLRSADKTQAFGRHRKA